MGVQSLTSSLSSHLDKVGPYLQEAVPQIRQVISKIGLRQFAHINLVYQLLDSGLANFLALETIRMGTSLPTYIKIQAKGGKFNRGSTCKDPTNLTKILNNRGAIFIESAETTLSHFPKDHKSLFIKIFALLAGAIQPVIKVRYSDSDEGIMKILKKKTTTDDHDSYFYVLERKPSAWSIKTSHLGITGSLRQGINSSIFQRISQKPGKFTLGCAQLIAAIALTCIYCGIRTGSPLINHSLTVLSNFKEIHYIVSNIGIGILYITTW